MAIRTKTWSESMRTYTALALFAEEATSLGEMFDIDANTIAVLRKRAPSFFGGRKSMWEDLTRVLMGPKPTAGIDTLYTLGVLSATIPELVRCRGVKQNDKHHHDDVFEHCVKVCDLSDQDVVLRWAGLLHDIGKPRSVALGPDGQPTFHRHEVFSTRLAKTILYRIGAPEAIASKIVNLVSLHMYYYSSEWTDGTVIRFLEKLGVTRENTRGVDALKAHPLFRLRSADRRSRGLEEKTPKQSDFEERLLWALWPL